MLWGKYWQLVHDQRTGLWQSQCADGRGLLIVVRLEFGSQDKVCCFFGLILL